MRVAYHRPRTVAGRRGASIKCLDPKGRPRNLLESALCELGRFFPIRSMSLGIIEKSPGADFSRR
jgi:hypothetical protein